jgi:hypothetical protein
MRLVRLGRRASAAPAPARECGSATDVPPPARERGSATAELAVSLPALVLLVFVALTAVAAVRVQLECVDAAREAALAAARGESGEAAGHGVAPPGAAVTVTIHNGTAEATVTAHVSPAGGRLPGFDVTATAVAATEPGVG